MAFRTVFRFEEFLAIPLKTTITMTPDNNWITTWSPLVAATGTWITGIGLIFIAVKTHNLSKQSKSADILMECHSRFDRIWEMRANFDVISHPEIFYARFWSLQFDQFEHWRDGFIPQKTFDYWMNSRKRQWIANSKLGTVSYQDGFRAAMKEWDHTVFKDFIPLVHEKSPQEAYDWLKSQKRKA